MANTGDKAYRKLEQWNPLTGLATGEVKFNHSNDPNYVPPVNDTVYCPLPVAEPTPTNTLSHTPNSYTGDFIDNFTIEVTANGNWAANKNQSWINLLTSSGGSGTTIMEVFLQKNNTTYMRNGQISFYMDGTLMSTFHVYQQSEF